MGQPSPQNIGIEQHSLPRSVCLHLLPGAVVSIAYLLIARPLSEAGFPSMFALCVAYVGIVPLELGYLLYLGRKRVGRLTLEGIVLYREKLSPLQYLIWVPLLFVISAGLLFALTPLSDLLFESFFQWVPGWALLDPGSKTYGRATLIITIIVVAVFVVVVYPVIEELYFRGYLLPRITRLGNGAIIVNSLLFGIYHFLEPWSLVARFVALIPVLWIVRRKENITIVIIIHCLGNLAALAALIQAAP